ncbi:BTAD domain-containing putative transcriptional regulator [Actinomadura sp. SCN-SB]|uniref:AfsR/SARP family transcriptional regulator n=1 Tax=Actinomadura sp. SCN-SB TaxID=3373092 RepID=UPI0037503DD5
MELRILGRVEVVSDEGEPTPVTRPLIRAALIALVLHRNTALTPERLIDLLWGPDGSGGDPLHGLRSCIWGIRKVLPPDRLVTDDVGYRLVIDLGRDRVDVDSFRDLHRRGRAALRHGDHLTAIQRLRAAVNLWQDAPISDLLPDTPAMKALVTGLAEEHRDAQNAWVQARLALGQHHDLLPELRTLVARDPLNEQLWSDLMLALYRCDLKADALHAFEEAQAALAAHADLEPGIQLRRLRRRIQADDAVLKPHQAAAIPSQLPPDVMDFTGRANEAAELTELLSPAGEHTAVPIIQISGPPGVGKTTLAVHVGHAARASYPDGQLYFHLAGSSAHPRSAHEVLSEALRALGVRPTDIPETTAQRAALYRTQLAGRRVLVMIDDAASPEHVRPLLPGTAGCAVIVTSRRQLIGLAGAHATTLHPFEDADALRLLAQIIGPARVDVEPDAADDIVAACGGLPLAVRIAAQRLAARPTWPLAYLARMLTDEKHRLDALVADDQAVRASIALSYQGLEGRAARAFHRLALVGPHDVAGWVPAVLLNEPAADEVIDTLVDHSLLAAAGVDALGQPRYRLHDLLRDYATERADTDPGSQAARHRLFHAWLELTALANAAVPPIPYFPPPQPARSPSVISEATRRLVTDQPHLWLATERTNLLAAIEAACAAGLYQLGAQLTDHLAAYLHLHSYHEDAERLWTLVGAAADRGDDQRFAAWARLRAGTVIAADRGRPARALPLFNTCIAGFEGADDRVNLARAYGLRGYCHQSLGQLSEAHADAEHGLDLARQVTDSHAQFTCLRILGLTLSQLGHHQQGIQFCQQALSIAHDLGLTVYIGFGLYALLRTRLLAGHYDAAIDLCEEGIRQCALEGHERGGAHFRQQMGLAYQHLDQHANAIEALTDALQTFQMQRDGIQTAYCLRLLATSYQATNRPREAINLLEEGIATYRRQGLSGPADELQATLAEYHRKTDPP